MQELKTSNRAVGGQYLNGLWTNTNEIWKFLIHIAHSKLLWNNHDNDKFRVTKYEKIEYLNIREDM